METDYVLLRNAANGDPASSGYALAGNVRASSAAAAIRAAADKGGAGTYVAIPARSFKPVTVKVETKQVVSFA